MGHSKKSANDDSGATQDSFKTRCNWTEEEDAVIIDELHIQKDAGKQAQSGWKPGVWKMVRERLEQDVDISDPPKTEDKCQDHWSSKKNVHNLSSQSGFGFCLQTKRVSATPEVWAQRATCTIPGTGTSTVILTMMTCSTLMRVLWQQEMATLQPAADHINNSPTTSTTKSGAEHESNSDSDDSPVSTPVNVHISDVASALCDLSAGMNAETTPMRHKRAVKLLEDDNEFSNEDFSKICTLFSENTGTMDMFAAISTKRCRTAFLQNKLL
uniref:Myb-like domain-containing protein n=1 Tax=Moniliophthora roreri TaxID=221103 RepID=A0A0W0G2J1_MONRR